MDPILASLQKASGNTYAFDLISNNPYKVESYIDTGCYFLNALMGNGDILCGCPMGKRITLAGAPSTAKSFFSAHLIKKFLDDCPTHYAVLFESEGASINEMADKLKIDKNRLIILPTFTVEEFKIQSMKVLIQIQDMQEKAKKAKKPVPKFLFVLDSIGMLSTEKSMGDAEEGKIKQDMTKQRQLKSVFCNITLLLSLTQTTLINIAHTYMCIEAGNKVFMSDGTLKNIEDIKEGEYVKTLEGDKLVEGTAEYEINSYVEIELEDGTIIRSTPNHPYLINNEWIEAIDIKEGYEIKSL